MRCPLAHKDNCSKVILFMAVQSIISKRNENEDNHGEQSKEWTGGLVYLDDLARAVWAVWKTQVFHPDGDISGPQGFARMESGYRRICHQRQQRGQSSRLNVTARKQLCPCKNQWIALPRVTPYFKPLTVPAFMNFTHIFFYCSKIELSRVSLSLCRFSLPIMGTFELLDGRVFPSEVENNAPKLASQQRCWESLCLCL